MGCCLNRRKEQKEDQQSECADVLRNISRAHNSSQEPIPREFQTMKRILLIGKSGVGKTNLFNQIKGPLRKKYQNSQFFEVVILEYDYVAVDTPAFELENTIDQRELIIKQFNDYFSKQCISTLAIVVNFDRTDLMKRKVLDIYKYLNKFQKMIVLIVVGWELNDNPDINESNLSNSFKQYTKNIIFLSKNQTNQDVIEKISKIVQPSPEQPMDLNNTIFEDFDPKDINILELLEKNFPKIMRNT